MDKARTEFLAGDRPEDVHIYLDERAVSNIEALEAHGERLDDGIALVLEGENARRIFQQTTGIDPMQLAQDAMGTDGDITPDCTDGSCPSCEASPRIIFAFAEAKNEDVGGMYAQGPVIHAYAACECGARYSNKWVATERTVGKQTGR